MFQKKTTIIIGAGASKEVDLPTGSELKDQIIRLLDFKFDYSSQINGSYDVCEALRSIARETPEDSGKIDGYIHAAWSIRDAMPQAISIDNFIDAHQGNKKIEICGKLAIASSILKAESESKLYFNVRKGYDKINFSKIQDTWFNSFLQLITENCRVSDLNSRLSSISLIIFNYDRCVEHFLYNALQNYYKISKDHAAELISKIEIFHPYGSLGDLPWMSSSGIEFGEDQHPNTLKSIVNKINTFTEGTDPESSQIKRIRNAIASSEILLFLGFAYHKQNLRLIKPQKEDVGVMKQSLCFGTSSGISKSNTKQIAEDLAGFGNLDLERISLSDLKCSQLFHEHWRRLSWD